MSDDKKKYVCKLPTNGYQPGDEVFLTDEEVANFNAPGEEPRFVLAEEGNAQEAPQAPEPQPEQQAPQTEGDNPAGVPPATDSADA